KHIADTGREVYRAAQVGAADSHGAGDVEHVVLAGAGAVQIDLEVGGTVPAHGAAVQRARAIAGRDDAAGRQGGDGPDRAGAAQGAAGQRNRTDRAGGID